MSADGPPRPASSPSPAIRLRPRRLVPIVGTIAGAAAGFAFYVLFGCDSG